MAACGPAPSCSVTWGAGEGRATSCHAAQDRRAPSAWPHSWPAARCRGRQAGALHISGGWAPAVRPPATPLPPMSQVICALQGVSLPVPACYLAVCLTPSCGHYWLGPCTGSRLWEPEGQQEKKWVAGQLSCARVDQTGCLDSEDVGPQCWKSKLHTLLTAWAVWLALRALHPAERRTPSAVLACTSQRY